MAEKKIKCPREAKIVSLLLQSQGVFECESSVILMLIEFCQREAHKIMQSANIYRKLRRSESKDISKEDLKLALQCKINRRQKRRGRLGRIIEHSVKINSKPITLNNLEVEYIKMMSDKNNENKE